MRSAAVCTYNKVWLAHRGRVGADRCLRQRQVPSNKVTLAHTYNGLFIFIPPTSGLLCPDSPTLYPDCAHRPDLI